MNSATFTSSRVAGKELMTRHDVVIVGGGFSGLSAALTLGRARRSVLVVDDARARWSRSEASFGVLARDGVSPAKLICDAKAQLEKYATVRILNAVAGELSGAIDGFRLQTQCGVIESKRIILAYGVRDQVPQIPGLPEMLGGRLQSCAYCHGYELDGGRIATLAPMSPESVRLLTEWGEVIYLAQGSPGSEIAAMPRVSVETASVEALHFTHSNVDIALDGGRQLTVAAVFVSPRTALASPIAEAAGCIINEMPPGPVIRIDSACRTSVPGVFACGDGASLQRSISAACASGALAGMSAHRSLVLGH